LRKEAALPRPKVHRGDWPWLSLAGVAAAIVFAPVVGLIYFASRGSGTLWPHLLANVLPVSLRTTAVLLIGVATVVIVAGVGTAWLIARYRFPGRNVLQWALVLPLAVPTYIAAFAYLDVFHPVGPVQAWLRVLLGITNPRDLWFPEIRSMGGAIFLLGLVLYPYVYLPVRALFLMQSPAAIEVAQTLGISRTRAFFRVALPLARPAVAVGVALALLETLNDIGASEFLGIRTLTVSIYTTWVTRSSIEGAAQIALFMLAIVAALIALERRGRRGERISLSSRSAKPMRPIRLRGAKGIGAMLACSIPILLGFVVPALYLLQSAADRIREFGLPRGLGSWVATSMGYAAATTVVAVVIGLALAYAARLVRHPAGAALVRVASLGYALPGTVLAVGLLVPLAGLDNAVDGWMRSLFGISTGLLLVGSGAALVLAYVIRFLSISIGGIEAGLTRINTSLDAAARSLGARPFEVIRRVHFPILRPAIAAAGLLVFVDCVKELPATLLLRPFNFESLSTQLYGEAIRGTYEAGAVSALAIVLVGIIPVLLLARAGERGFRNAVSTRVA
jgi:iron(III) transport system permease protein